MFILKSILTMMKKVFLLCSVMVGALSLGSCVGISKTASNNLTQTKVVLQSNNFEVVGQAYGEVSSTYVFGIGGMNPKNLKSNAIHEMSKNANLTGSQTLINVTTHTSKRMITPFYVKAVCTATATIVEFK